MYVKIRSWHVIRTWTRVPQQCETLCGKTVSNTAVDGQAIRGSVSDYFGDEKTCETCLRIRALNG